MKINEIFDKCTTKEVFKSNQALDIINYIEQKYKDKLEFLWEKFDNNAIWRNKQNNKWYGILLLIPKSKLEIESDDIIEVIDLRYQKEKIGEEGLEHFEEYIKTYSQNREHPGKIILNFYKGNKWNMFKACLFLIAQRSTLVTNNILRVSITSIV